jgi:acyl-CoA dehydrogenase
LPEKVAAKELVLVSTGANDWLESNGTVEPAPGGYRVSAVKPFASGSPVADMMVTSAAFDGAEDGPQVLHFPVPLSAEGIELKDDWRTLGMRGTGSQTVRLDGVFVPEEAVVLRRPRGPFHPAFAVILTVAMPLISSVYRGTAERAGEIALDAVRSRADDPVTQILAGELGNALATAGIATDAMIDMAEGYAFTPSAALAADVLTRKTLAANASIAAATKALELAGGGGYFRKMGLERFLRDVQGARFHPLPEKKQHLFCGRLSLGLDPASGASQDESRKAA